jgi:hypothetical protein
MVMDDGKITAPNIVKYYSVSINFIGMSKYSSLLDMSTSKLRYMHIDTYKHVHTYIHTYYLYQYLSDELLA